MPRINSRSLLDSFSTLQILNFLIIGIAGYGYILFQYIVLPNLLPYGSAIKISKKHRITNFKDTDYNNNDGFNGYVSNGKHKKLRKIYERMDNDSNEEGLLKGPETVVFDNEGTMYVLTEQAKLVMLTDFIDDNNDDRIITAKVTLVANLGSGRPLGGKFTVLTTGNDDSNNTLYIADTILGLTKIEKPKLYPKSKVELIASKVTVDVADKNGNNNKKVTSPILFADDVAIGPKTGYVYFSDATDVTPERILKTTSDATKSEFVWDVMHASKIDCLRGKKAGRLLRYDPITNEVTVLIDHNTLGFANGVAVTKDEKYVLVVETYGFRVLKYEIATGKIDIVVDTNEAPGIMDGMDCNWSEGEENICYIAVASSHVPLLKLAHKAPYPISYMMRTLFMMLPRSLTPKPVPYGGIMKINIKTKESTIIQDPTGTDIKFIMGVTIHNNMVYLGSLYNPYVGIYDPN